MYLYGTEDGQRLGPWEENKEALKERAVRGLKAMMGEPTETADLSLWELMDSGPTAWEAACC